MLLLKITTESFGEGLIYSALGFIVVLIVLLLITFLLYGFSMVINYFENKKKRAEASEAAKQEVNEAPVPIAETVSGEEDYEIDDNDEIDDTELVAVISAAIAASAAGSQDKLVVRSVRQVDSWKRESIRQKNRGLH